MLCSYAGCRMAEPMRSASVTGHVCRRTQGSLAMPCANVLALAWSSCSRWLILCSASKPAAADAAESGLRCQAGCSLPLADSGLLVTLRASASPVPCC